MEVPDEIATDMAKVNFKQKVKTVEVCHVQTWKKTKKFTQARIDRKLFYPKKCVNFDKSEFATTA